ncbi:hypothetical protein E1A91_A09G187300v1 [Gossypium mustelinum]|uniref:Uncharacterized protein n=1 Tax=Gossypium mustelinum TaxID=34275 RepID=A0A5D2Y0A0_GOSMU|nr:hypothetical protein E1A91_A09G187300v1 [Gossypium mustelinum]
MGKVTRHCLFMASLLSLSKVMQTNARKMRKLKNALEKEKPNVGDGKRIIKCCEKGGSFKV